ncbi:site-2 protease family protein [Candidatus Micrarchaeota archaeon]|nr:site-2 protease family protein [Candidatus Micrarchaeota archaeon]
MEWLYFEKEELVQIAISVVAISFAFTLAFAGPDALLRSPREFFLFTLLSFVTVGSGFILHEMAHKLVAIYYGAQAKFRMWIQGLLVMLATSFFGFLFAAPGAVYIYSDSITKEENGIISLVGPLTNLAIAGAFILLGIVKPVVFSLSFFRGSINAWHFGAQINIMLALFNMIPGFPLDGSKVFAWNKIIWGITIVLLLALGAVIINPFVIVSWGIMLLIVLVFSKLVFG